MNPALRAHQDDAQWLRVTLASIGDGVITTDSHGQVTMLNPVAQQLTGWTQEEAVNRPLMEVFHIVNLETKRAVENSALRCLKDGVFVGADNHTILIAKDGTERNVDDSAAPIMNEQGEVAGAILVFRDITERYAAAQQVADGRAYCENILGTLRHAFLVLDKEMRVVSANRAFCKRFQVEEKATQGQVLYDLGNGQWNIPKLRLALEVILPTTGHSLEDFEVEHDFETIGRKVMSLNARKVNMTGNHAELILLVIEDITERRQAEQALTDSETRYRRLFETAKDGILILDAHTGKVIDANAFMGGLSGIQAHELIGKELHEIGLFADIEESKRAFRELQQNGYVRYDHLPIQRQKGGSVEVEVVGNVYREEHKLVAQCNVRDISQRVVMERKIQEQTEALAGESRRKDEFLAMLSHELRNPLAPIRSAVHLLRSKGRSVNENIVHQQAHEIIERQVANLTKIVGDLLEVSRVMSGKIRLAKVAVDLNQVVKHAVETSTPILEQHKHKVVVRLCPAGEGGEATWVNADPTRMEEVFVNLLRNAAKYTPDGGMIEVWCERPRGANHAQFRVRDNGMGIDKDMLPRIFDLFSQADRSLARSAGGLGIGLSLAHRLVELHGGTIEAHSPPTNMMHGMEAKGSEFIVRLPLVPPPLQSESTQTETTTAKPSDERDIRILVVDDNIDLVLMLSSSLRQKGHSVQMAYTGPDGLKVAQQWHPDVVLLDIGLPGLDGYEVARRIRSGGTLGAAGAKMRLIALTGYGRDIDVALARGAGFDAHLTKPVEFEELEKMIAARHTA